MHLIMGDMLITMEFLDKDWKEEIPAILQATAWALCSTIHTMAGYMPG